ncbi:MAG: creatininase family protein [Anaerolineae bacterium]
MQLADISWDQCQEYLTYDNRILLPIGATEAHGRHLGLGCDHILAEAIARQAGEQTGVLVAPVLAYGMSYHLTKFPGTLSLAPATLVLVLRDLLYAAYQYGFRRMVVVNGHGGNDPSLSSAAADLGREFADLRIKNLTWWTEPAVAQLVDQAAGSQRGTHASTHETAFLMATRPEAIHMDRVARRDAPVEPSRDLINPRMFAEKYPDSVMGLAPLRATPELGQQILSIAVDLCVQELGNW